MNIHKQGRIAQGESPATPQAVAELLRLSGIAASAAESRAVAKTLARLSPLAGHRA